jgi:hypothetical protein
VSDVWRPPAQDPFVGLTDEGRLAESIRERARERDLRQQATEFATFAGTVRDLAEAARTVVIRSASGRSYQGRLTALGLDHVVLRTPADLEVRIAVDQVVAIDLDPTAPGSPAAGDREPEEGRSLLEVLADLLEDRPVVVLVARGGGGNETSRGRLLAVGEDIVSMQPETGLGVRYVPAGAIAELVVEP